MFRNNDLLKLSVTLILLVATAFVSATAVAAAGSYTIIQAKAASAAIGGTADTSDWYGRHADTVISAGAADLSDYFQRHADTVVSAGAADLSDYFQRHSDTSILANTATGALIPSLLDNPNGYWIGPETVSAALSQLDNSNGHWIGPETVSAALGQLQPYLPAGSQMYYGPPGR